MSPVVSKLIFEVRFRPTLLFFEEMFKIASTLEEEFEHWKAKHNPSSAILFDTKKKISLNVSSQGISFSTENPKYISSASKEFTRLLTLFFENTKIEEIGRVGVRRSTFFETNSKYETFVDNFFKKFYGSKEQITDLAADRVTDVAYILDGIKDGMNTHIQFGPVKPEEAENYYTKEDYSGSLRLKKPTNIFIDSDVYSSVKMDFPKLIDTLDPLIDLNTSLHDGMASIVKKELLL